MNNLNEDIKILEEFIKYYESEAISRKFRGTLSISVDEYDIEAIEHLIKAYKELEEENSLLIQQNITYKRNTHDLKNKNIPVSLVEEKIERKKEYKLKYEQEFSDNKDENYFFDINAMDKEIQVLQELLEE